MLGPDRTLIEAPLAPVQFGYGHAFTVLGSCFAACMGQRLAAGKFQVHGLEMGTLFNPVNLAWHITTALNGERKEDALAPYYLQREDIFFNYQFHSSHSATSQAALEAKLRSLHSQLRQGLLQSQVLVLTLGTAWAWQLNQNQQLIANCHKQPSPLFSQRLLALNEVTESLAGAINRLREENPSIQIILTVSPVRHTRQGLANNQLSKSLLRLACHQLSQQLTNCHYFPAYEAMVDDLRDYRYYGDDLIHPTAKAEEYIWQLFTKAWLEPEALALYERWRRLERQLHHRPLHPGPTYLKQLQKLEAELAALPLNLQAELDEVRIRIDAQAGS